MKKIMIADDSEYTQEKLKFYIPKTYQIVTASSGEESRALYKQERPDLVLLDIVMPEGEEEGLSVLRDIKQLDPKAQVVMISAIGSNEVMETCKKLGITDYVEKPFDKHQIESLLTKYLG